MKRILPLAALVATLTPCHAQNDEAEGQPAAQFDAARAYETFRPSAARVEITPKFDNNNPPDSPFLEFMRDGRPVDYMGWMVAPDMVLIPDTGISTRFVESVAVVSPDGAKTPARQHAVFAGSPAMLVKTDAPIPGAAPPAFAKTDPPPQQGFLMSVAKQKAEWVFKLEKLDLADTLPTFNARRGEVARMEKSGLFLTVDGEAAGFLLPGVLDPEKPFAVPPFGDADLLLMDDLAAAEKSIDALCGKGILLATLNFRSPRQGPQDRQSRWSGENSEDASTVQYAVALHLAPGRLLVLKACDAKQTARLESITVQDAGGNAVEAVFAASLENFGAFIADAPGLSAEPLEVWAGDLRDLEDAAAQVALVTTPGDTLLLRHNRSRFAGFRENWKDHLTAGFAFGGREAAALVFAPRGGLLTLSVARRNKEEGRYSSAPSAENFGAAAFAALVADPPASEVNAANTPLSEREENRAAWLGVEMQALTPQLAQEMKITRFTGGENAGRYSNENTGGVVTFVHPGSPAEKAGLKNGDVVLRVHAEGRAQPYLVRIAGEEYSREFPWAQYDQIPAEYFDRGYIPTPWPSANNAAGQILTAVGFGKAVRIECVVDGELKEFPMVVEVGPDTYESAPQHESAALGLHVRDLTYEARHYFRRGADDPGVIVSRVEAGRHAAVAGIKPYEMIVKVNDAEVRNVAEFAEQVGDRQELRFVVRRMNRERIVPVNLAEQVKADADGGDDRGGGDNGEE